MMHGAIRIRMIIKRMSLEVKCTIRKEHVIMGVFNVHVALFYIDCTMQITGGYVNDPFTHLDTLTIYAILAVSEFYVTNPCIKMIFEFMQKERSEEEMRMRIGDGLKGYGHGY